ncbi:MAG: hypothetical protein IT372_26565 [Polyangiaceae bacterium]|nr:hypothetical protein [Polyangiaceae bacterium]
MSRRERIIQLGAEIQADRTSLAALRERMRAKEAELDRLLKEGGEDEVDDQSTTVTAGSMASDIVTMLDADPAAEFEAEDIATRLDKKITSVRSTLARLAKNGSIRKVTHGRYASAKRTETAHLNGTAYHKEGTTVQ